MLFPLAAGAQGATVQVGDKVRVRLERHQLTGVVEALDERTLTVRRSDGGQVITLDRDALRRVDVSRGRASRGRNAGRGALIGGIIGAAAGAFAMSCANPHDECGGAWIPIGAGVLGAGGALVGAGIGATVSPGEDWRKGSLPGVRAAIVPVARGAQLRVSVVF